MNDIEKRLLSRSSRDGECLRWQGAHTPSGYGQLRVAGRGRSVHRLAYECWVGPIPDGLVIDHLCRVRDCLEPSHLEAVTQHTNLLRGEGFPGTQARKTHCKWGHEFTDDNTLRRGRARVCRTCKRAEKRAYKKRKREALRDA